MLELHGVGRRAAGRHALHEIAPVQVARHRGVGRVGRLRRGQRKRVADPAAVMLLAPVAAGVEGTPAAGLEVDPVRQEDQRIAHRQGGVLVAGQRARPRGQARPLVHGHPGVRVARLAERVAADHQPVQRHLVELRLGQPLENGNIHRQAVEPLAHLLAAAQERHGEAGVAMRHQALHAGIRLLDDPGPLHQPLEEELEAGLLLGSEDKVVRPVEPVVAERDAGGVQPDAGLGIEGDEQGAVQVVLLDVALGQLGQEIGLGHVIALGLQVARETGSHVMIPRAEGLVPAEPVFPGRLLARLRHPVVERAVIGLGPGHAHDDRGQGLGGRVVPAAPVPEAEDRAVAPLPFRLLARVCMQQRQPAPLGLEHRPGAQRQGQVMVPRFFEVQLERHRDRLPVLEGQLLFLARRLGPVIATRAHLKRHLVHRAAGRERDGISRLFRRRPHVQPVGGVQRHVHRGPFQRQRVNMNRAGQAGRVHAVEHGIGPGPVKPHALGQLQLQGLEIRQRTRLHWNGDQEQVPGFPVHQRGRQGGRAAGRLRKALHRGRERLDRAAGLGNEELGGDDRQAVGLGIGRRQQVNGRVAAPGDGELQARGAAAPGAVPAAAKGAVARRIAPAQEPVLQPARLQIHMVVPLEVNRRPAERHAAHGRDRLGNGALPAFQPGAVEQRGVQVPVQRDGLEPGRHLRQRPDAEGGQGDRFAQLQAEAAGRVRAAGPHQAVIQVNAGAVGPDLPPHLEPGAAQPRLGGHQVLDPDADILGDPQVALGDPAGLVFVLDQGFARALGGHLERDAGAVQPRGRGHDQLAALGRISGDGQPARHFERGGGGLVAEQDVGRHLAPRLDLGRAGHEQRHHLRNQGLQAVGFHERISGRTRAAVGQRPACRA